MPQTITSLRQIEHHIDDSIRLYRNRQPDDYPAHWHMPYEIILPEENSYTVLIEGTRYELWPEDVMIIPSGVVHEIFAPQSGRRLFLMIEREELAAIENLLNVEHCFYPCLHIRADLQPELAESVRSNLMELIREYETQGILSRAAVRYHAAAALIAAARSKLDTLPAGHSELRKNHQQLLFSDICTYVSEHCSEHLTPEGVAARGGYSRYHFERLFRSLVGMTFHDFLTLQRLNMCKRLLASGNDPITDVAMKSGFGSIATFNRVFQAHEGMSPTEYRSLKQQLRNL